MIPDISRQTYDAARHGAGLIARADRGRIVVSGKDRASYLHGLLTNDISTLGPGQGCYAAYLTPQGRMITDLWVYEIGDLILLIVPGDVKDVILAKLDQFIFTEDVQLGDVTATFGEVAVVGPRSAEILARALEIRDETLSGLGQHGNVRVPFMGQSAIVLQIDDLGEPGYDVVVEAGHLQALCDRLRHDAAVDIDEETAETLRIEGGVPKFHRDMDEETIPLEAGIEGRAISMTKGCYVGQEVIVRVLHRGHGRVARKLVGLVLADGPIPERGSVVRTDGRDIGKVTSATWSPALHHPIALAYLQRDFIAPGTRVLVNERSADVTALPFRQ